MDRQEKMKAKEGSENGSENGSNDDSDSEDKVCSDFSYLNRQYNSLFFFIVVAVVIVAILPVLKL